MAALSASCDVPPSPPLAVQQTQTQALAATDVECSEPDAIEPLAIDGTAHDGAVTVVVRNHAESELAVGLRWRVLSEKNNAHGTISLGALRSGEQVTSVLDADALQVMKLDLSEHLGAGELVVSPCVYSLYSDACLRMASQLDMYFTVPDPEVQYSKTEVVMGRRPTFGSRAGERFARSGGLLDEYSSEATLTVFSEKRSDSASYIPEPDAEGGAE